MEVIEHDVRRLDRLVSDISNASRLDAELVKEEEEEFDLLTMLGNLNQFLGEDARSKGIDYIADLPPQPIMLQGLEARLAQVFVNLITNAADAMMEQEDRGISIAVTRGERITVSVSDDGPGIADPERIFEPFYTTKAVGSDEDTGGTAGTAGTGGTEGMGLGLSISYGLVQSFGGNIRGVNGPGGGAVFTVELDPWEAGEEGRAA